MPRASPGLVFVCVCFFFLSGRSGIDAPNTVGIQDRQTMRCEVGFEIRNVFLFRCGELADASH